MFSSGAYDYVDVMSKVADASWLREEVIANNIANIDTPGYKRKEVEFSTYLAAAINAHDKQNLNKNIKNAELEGLEPLTYTDHAELSTRLDGNNVDIDTESAELASEQLRYNGVIESISNEFKMFKTAMTRS